MMNNSAFYAKESASLELAWARAYLKQTENQSREMAPFTACIASSSGLSLPDTLTHPLAKALNASLTHQGLQDVEKVAFPLFPERLWKVSDGNRQAFYAEFLRNQRTYIAWESKKNQGGLYFGRMIGFGLDHKTGKPLGYKASKTLAANGNQLEHIIERLKLSVERGKSVPRMQLQATTADPFRDAAADEKASSEEVFKVTIFDPFRDLTTTGQPRFPCLQHIAFDPDVRTGSLAMTAFYATQQLYVKAFGNWLGLCRLGQFVAGQSGLKFTKFTCFAGVQKMSVAPKTGELKLNLIRAATDVAGLAIEGDRMVEENVG